MKNLFLSVLLIIPFSIFAQVEIGQKAPPILAQWVDNPNSEFKDLKGKAIVLDFWFTSCAPCVYTIPHLNDLTEKYKDENIAFVAISFEEEPDISRFLDKKKLFAIVGSDTSYQTIKRFGVESYPTTFLIDERGILRWTGHASQLNADQLDFLLGKQYFSKVEDDAILPVKKSNKDFKTDLIYPISVEINTYMEGASGMQFQKTELSIVNQSLAEIMANLIQKNSQRIEVTDTNRYDVRFKIPEDLPEEKITEAITKSLANELKLQIKEKQKSVDGFELHVVNDSLFIANAIIPDKVYLGMGASTFKTYWKGSGVWMSHLVDQLEDRFGIYIVDKTKLNGFFEFKLMIESLGKARQYLLEEYGLILKPKKIEVTFTEIGL